MNFGFEGPSNYNKWPTKEVDSLYNLKSMWLELESKRLVHERSTYSFLDWLGDVGGLFDGLILVGG